MTTTTVWTPEWTRDPFPSGSTVALRPQIVCRTCGCNELRVTGPFTRSTEPSPSTGEYLMKPHTPWCPIWTGVVPLLPCPSCGGPVHGIDSERGYRLIIPDPHRPGGIAHIVGTADELQALPHAMLHGSTPQRSPERDKVTVSPCGDILLGADAHQLLIDAATLRRQHFADEAARTIADAQPLLDAAHRAGRGALADAYINAVRTRAGTTRGLLLALQILDGTR